MNTNNHCLKRKFCRSLASTGFQMILQREGVNKETNKMGTQNSSTQPFLLPHEKA